MNVALPLLLTFVALEATLVHPPKISRPSLKWKRVDMDLRATPPKPKMSSRGQAPKVTYQQIEVAPKSDASEDDETIEELY